MWYCGDSELPKATRMPANIIDKHPLLKSSMQNNLNNLKMFRLNHLALQIECN